MDATFGPIKKFTYPPYAGMYAKVQDIDYAEHDQEDKVVQEINDRYDINKQTVCIVGHSWGGDTALKCCRRLAPKRNIVLLVTLDPVSSRLTRNTARPSNVKEWINVYVNYDKAPWSDPLSANSIAMTGGPWGACSGADKNIEFPYYNSDAHAHANDMFRFVKEKVSAIR